jgi:hypothetical protein
MFSLPKIREQEGRTGSVWKCGGVGVGRKWEGEEGRARGRTSNACTYDYI